MSGTTNTAVPIQASKDMKVDGEGIFVEKVEDESDLVQRMNNLDPPVTHEEEKKLCRKIDLRLPPFLFFLYIFTWLDRSALGNAALMGILEDINLSSDGFSLAVAMFFAGACVGELFSNILMRYIRPSLYLSGAMCLWGAIAALQAAAKDIAGLCATRFFLGIFEACFISGAPYVTSMMYPRAQWGKRISVYLGAIPFAGAFGGWIAFGVAHVESTKAIKNWQILFILEGLLTIVFGVVSYFFLPDRPHDTKWLNQRERDVAEWRMMRDGNRTRGKVHWGVLGRQLIDWRMWVNIVIYMCQVLSTYTISTFTPIITATVGYDSVQAQLMVAPPYCVAFVMCFVVGYISDRLRSCSGLLVLMASIACVGDLICVLLPIENGHGRYAGLFLIITGTLAAVSLSLGNVTGNCCGDVKKGVATGLYLSFGSTMGVVTGYIFPETDSPAYRMGFWVLFGTSATIVTLSLFMTLINRWDNSRRDRKHGKPPTNTVIDFDENGLMENHPYWRWYL